MIMKKFIGFLLSVLVINCQIGWVWAAQHEVQLLVLSEIEERIAGRMAFYTLERKLRDRGITVTTDPTITAIGQAVAYYSDRVHLDYAFYVLEGPLEPQALALPGGYVLISRSIIDAVCQTEDDIAFILGHEIAHAALRHYADYKLSDEQQVAYVKQLIQQQQFVAEAEQPKYSEELHNVLFPYIMKLRQIKEIEADQFGALYALRAGYHFSGSTQVLRRLRRLYGDDFQLEQDLFAQDQSSNLSTHPTLSERIEQLEIFRIKAIEVSKLFPQGRDALDRGDYQEASLIFESILSLFPQSRTARIGLGVAYHLQYWDSSEGDQFLLAYPGALELENIQLLRGKPDWNMLQRAITEYRQVLHVEPGNKYAANNLGVALAELRQVTEAEATLREALRVDAQDFILFNLGLVLYQSYQEDPRPPLKEEAATLLRQYLQFVPTDQVAVEYLQTLEQDECP